MTPRPAWLPNGDAALHALLVGLALGLFVLPPLAELRWVPRILPSLVTLATLVAGMFALTTPTRLLWPAAAAAVLAAGALGLGGPLVGVAAAISLALLALALLRQVLADGTVTGARIEGALALYLLVALAFACLYDSLEAFWPGSFTGAISGEASFRYFSLIVQATIGFGDIVPANGLARALVTLQAVIGQVFVAVLLARLVSLELAGRSDRR